MIIKCMKCGQLCEGVAFPSEDGLVTLCPQCAAEAILRSEKDERLV